MYLGRAGEVVFRLILTCGSYCSYPLFNIIPRYGICRNIGSFERYAPEDVIQSPCHLLPKCLNSYLDSGNTRSCKELKMKDLRELEETPIQWNFYLLIKCNKKKSGEC